MLPVSSDRGLSFLPTCTFEDCPPLDLICLPGGPGVVEALADVETVDFIRRQGEHAKYATSVCMGAFLLGAAGLLKGRRATTHWAYVDLLPLVGATHEKARVVRDGNVFTAGGVTSGIDFAFISSPRLPDPMSRKRSSSVSSTTRLLPSMLATLTRHQRRPLRSWFTATELPTKGFRRSLRVWRSKASLDVNGRFERRQIGPAAEKQHVMPNRADWLQKAETAVICGKL